MKSRKMLLMTLFTEQQRKCRHKEWTTVTVAIGEHGKAGEWC